MMHIDSIYALMKTDLKKTEQLVLESLHSPIELINELSSHIIKSGGKRIRPLLVLLSAKVFGYQGDLHIRLAAVVELIHTATLLHDDVVDSSALRRGQETANAIWGNQASVLVGDYLYSHAFRLMVDMNDLSIMDTLAQSTSTIVQGEILQLLNCHNPKTTETAYLEVIRCKTGQLFKTSAQLGAMIAGCSEIEQKMIGEYGLHLGIAFQLIDDALDYHADVTKAGKNVGDDLAEGKATLPLIRAMQKCTSEEAHLIEQSLISGDRTYLEEILRIIKTTQAMQYTDSLAQQMIAKAINCLEDIAPSKYRDALTGLAKFVIQRDY
jgi:octaprenyl-diphosphate synthase